MIRQSREQNQPDRECLYAWYPEAIDNNAYTTITDPRDIYLRNGLDRDLLEQKPSNNGLTSTYNSSSNTDPEVTKRYKQSLVPSELAYHSLETINEALNPPWALQYQLKRQIATPNLPSNTNDMSTHEQPPRRLKSAPVVRSFPSTPVLNIPEPRFITAFVPVPTTTDPTPPSFRPKTRALSAKGRLNSTLPTDTKPVRRDTKSARISRQKGSDGKLSDEEIEQIFKRVYGNTIEQPQQVQPVQIIYTEPQSKPPPVYIYQKSATWCPDEIPATSPARRSLEVTAIPLNPHYLHRGGVIAVRNVEKKSVVRETSASKRSTKHHRRYQSVGKRNEPLLAFTPLPQKTRLSLEIGGVKLTLDRKLNLNDKSPNLTKYFIDGRLYLIKDQCYNVLENIDPSSLKKSHQPSTHHQRPKYYQTIPVEQYQLPPSSPPTHHNISDTYFHHTSSPKRLQRYVIDPNLISENLNVNRMSFANRPPIATIYA